MLEFELMLKVFFSEHGTRDDVRTSIRSIADWAEERRRQHVAVAVAYTRGEGQFPQRMAQTALVGTFLTRFADTVAEWAAWAGEQVETWPEDLAQASAAVTAIAARAEPPAVDPPG